MIADALLAILVGAAWETMLLDDPPFASSPPVRAARSFLCEVAYEPYMAGYYAWARRHGRVPREATC